MIEVEVTNGRPVVRAVFPPGWLAFIDADWFPRAGGRVPAIAVSPAGGIAWCESSAGRVPPGSDPEACVGRALWAVAEEAARLARQTAAPWHVQGRGFIAARVRDALGLDSSQAEPPAAEAFGAIVDTTGDPDGIAEATRRLADLGVLVLAGETAGGAMALDLYSDIHVRGLRVIGVAPPLHDRLPEAPAGVGDAGQAVRERQRLLRPGEVVPDGPLLYRISS